MFAFRYVSRIWIWIFVIYLFFIFVMCYCGYRYINFIYKQVWRWGRVPPKKKVGSRVRVGVGIRVLEWWVPNSLWGSLDPSARFKPLGLRPSLLNPWVLGLGAGGIWGQFSCLLLTLASERPRHSHKSDTRWSSDLIIDLNAWMGINPALIPAQHWLIPCAPLCTKLTLVNTLWARKTTKIWTQIRKILLINDSFCGELKLKN